MKTVKQFKEQIAREFMEMDAVRKLYGLDGTKSFEECFPAVSVEGIFIYLWAFGAWVITSLFDRHRADVLAELATLKPHTLRWYVTKAKAYQHGCELPTDESGQYCSDTYETIRPDKQIVRYAVAKEIPVRDTIVLSLKVAKYVSKERHTPAQLSAAELDGLKRYLANIKDAGVPIQVQSNKADEMQVEMKIFYNPMILEKNRSNILVNGRGEDVVRLAIEQVIENLPFNGDCRNSDILDAVKNIDGVEVADILSIRSKPSSQDYRPVVGYCTPESGYFRLASLKLDLECYNNGNQI